MHKLRVWMRLHCSDRKVWIYRDVTVPIIPRVQPGDKDGYCDFYLTGLFSEKLYTNWPDKGDSYVDGQPDEPLYLPCYDINAERWHVYVTEHKSKHTWKEAITGPYREWTESDRPVDGPVPTPAVVATSAHVVTGDQGMDIGRTIVLEAARYVRSTGLTRFRHALSRPEAVRYLVARAAQHTDPTAPVVGVIHSSGIVVSGIERRLGKILEHFADEARLFSDPVLRVGDLAGKTYEDIDKITDVGPLAMVSLVASGLIPMEK